MHHLTYLEALVIGLLQGVTELFPVSSLGHSILLPALFGGSWANDLNMSAPQSPYLTFLVAVHVATAAGLFIFFRRDWVRIIQALVASIRNRAITTSDERLAWLLVAATIPVGLAGLALDHVFRTMLGRPIPAALFLTINGVVLYVVERGRARQVAGVDGFPGPTPVRVDRTAGGRPAQVYMAAGYGGTGATAATAGPGMARAGMARAGMARAGAASPAHGGPDADAALASDGRLSRLSWSRAIYIGSAQILALLPGISRSGITMAAGLRKGLSHEDAARFAFLLATPVIAAAGLLKLPELAGPEGNGILGQVVLGALAAGIGAYVSVRYLTRYFETRTLKPFAIYCTVAGVISLIWLAVA